MHSPICLNDTLKILARPVHPRGRSCVTHDDKLTPLGTQIPKARFARLWWHQKGYMTQVQSCGSWNTIVLNHVKLSQNVRIGLSRNSCTPLSPTFVHYEARVEVRWNIIWTFVFRRRKRGGSVNAAVSLRLMTLYLILMQEETLIRKIQ